MRKNPYYAELQEKTFEDIEKWGERKKIKFSSDKRKAKINQIFKEYGKEYIIDVYRLALRHMRNMYR